MKSSWFWHVGFLIFGVVLGVFFGSGVSDENQTSVSEAPNRDEEVSNIRSSRLERGTASSPGLARRIKEAEADDLPNLLYLALEEPDAFLRQGNVTLALLKMNESNWKEMYGQFGQITSETGKRHYYSWKAALERSGQVGGREAVVLHLEDAAGPKYDQAWDVLYGWAQMKPSEAMDWLQNDGNGDPAARSRLLSAVLAGHALTSPKTAPAVLESLPSNERSACVGHFTWNLVQSGGVDMAIDWMLNVNDKYGTDDPQFAQRVTGEVMGTMASTTSGRGRTDLLAQRIERIYQRGPVDPKRTRGVINQLSGTEPLDLILDLSDKAFFEELNHDGLLVQEVVTTVKSRSPDRFETWLADHPEASVINTVGVD